MAGAGPVPLRLPLPGTGRLLEGLAAGPADGDLVLCLHGFPQDATAFADVLPLLGVAGLRAVAVTQRGYTAANRPPDGQGYALHELARDVLDLAHALGTERFHLVGHDWGAVVSWYLAATEPARVRSLTAVSVPHPAAYVAALGRSRQALRSAYVALFNLPVVSEALLERRAGSPLRRALRRSGLEAARVDAYVDRLLAEGGLHGALSWYRGTGLGTLRRVPVVTVPTTFMWSDGDVALDRAGAEATGRWVAGPYRFEIVPDASHWLPEQHPTALAQLVTEGVQGA